MMYNPYNWTIKKKTHNMNMPVFPGAMVSDKDIVFPDIEIDDKKWKCIFEELTEVSNELDMCKIHFNKVTKDLRNIEKRMVELERKRVNVIEKFYQE